MWMSTQAGWLASVPYLAAVLAMVGVSWASDRLQKRKRFVWPPLLIAAVAFYGSYALGSEHFWLSYALLVGCRRLHGAPYGLFFAIVPEIPSGQRRRRGHGADQRAWGALGSFGGSWLVGYLNGATGGPGASYLFMCGALLTAVALTAALNTSQTSGRAKRNSSRLAMHEP